nr:transposase [Solimonas marina]
MKPSRFTNEQKTKIVQQLNAGTPLLTLCCENKISASTIYIWRKFQRQQQAELDPPATDPMRR